MNYQEADLCRVCLQHGATIPIFDVKDSPDPDVYSKLCQCLGEKVKDVVGLPRHLCEPCLGKLNSAVQFIQQYKESEKLVQHCLKFNNNIVNLYPDEKGMLNVEAEYLDENLFDESNLFQNDADGVANKIKIENVEYTIDGAEDIEFVDQNDINCDAIVGKLGECDVEKVSVIPAQINISENCSKKAKNIKNSQTKVEQKENNVVKKVLGQKAKSFDAENKTFPCKTCKETFGTHGKLKYHRQTHGGTKKCPHCDKDIKKNVFSRHLATVHATSRNYSCPFCGMRFTTRNYCTRHEKVVHLKTNTPLRYDCTLCDDKHYTSKPPLDVHMRSVHTGERPFVCDLCEKNFTFKAYLKEHMLQHTSERPHKCPICGKGHTVVANVKSHLRHNHRISELDDATLDALSKSKINYLKHMRP